MSKKINNILAEKNYVLEKVEGHDLEGNPQFAQVLIRQDKIDEFRKAIAVNDIRLEDYGYVVVAGNSDKSPEGLEEIILKILTKPAS